MLQWINTIVLNEKNISTEDLDDLTNCRHGCRDGKIINDFYTQYKLKPNF